MVTDKIKVRLGKIIGIMDSEHGFVTKKHLTNSEEANDGAVIIPEHKFLVNSPSSSSESSMDSSYVEKEDPSDTIQKSKQANLDPKGQVSGHNPSTSIHEPSAAIYPQNQISKQSEDYDPNRIPASVFARTPMEWSVASTESLFSLHMGNSSFSRDSGFMQYKSGELHKFDETNSPPPAPLPIIVEKVLEKKIQDISEDSKVTEEKPVEPAKAVVKPELPPNNTKAVPVGTEKSISQEKASPAEDLRQSSSSTQSFKFPL